MAPNRGPSRHHETGRKKTILRVFSLAAALFLFWLGLSGHYTPFLVVSGLVIASVVALLGVRSGYADEEGHPVDYLLKGLLYWPWLLWEIAKSSFSVARIILDPKLPISPRLIRVKASQRTAVGIATYAKSITLTPGTITIEVSRRTQQFIVHALTAESAADLQDGAMNDHVRSFEGRE